MKPDAVSQPTSAGSARPWRGAQRGRLIAAVALTVLLVPGARGPAAETAGETAGEAIGHAPAAHRSAEDYDSTVAEAWMELLYDVVKREAVFPTTAARAYGIASVVLYETVVPGSSTNRSLGGQLNALDPLPAPRVTDLHWPAAANAALAVALSELFPKASAGTLRSIAQREKAFADAFRLEVSPDVYQRSVAHGRETAAAILKWAASDGLSDHAACPYTPPSGPGLWRLTPGRGVRNETQACWGELRPMALESRDECAPPAPVPFSTAPDSAFYAQAKDVYDVRSTLTPEQKAIAYYWADDVGVSGTPPGHWMAIMSQIARNDRLPLMAAAEGYARVGISVSDAMLSCWRAKYKYNLIRPVSYIRDVMEPEWLPLLITPLFPEHTSGHSTQSGAAATALTTQFGRRAFTDTTPTDHGLPPPLRGPRTFSSFDEAADEAALSRLYGGIHFRKANLDGIAQGRCIGKAIAERIRFRKD